MPEGERAAKGRFGRFLSRADEEHEAGGQTTDPLTGLSSRGELAPLLETAVEHGRPFSAYAVLAFVDVGMLREVNDSYGKDAGDELLVKFAERLRSIDVPGVRVARYGSATFAVIFERVMQIEHAGEIARFLVEQLSAPYEISTGPVTVTATVGAAMSSDTHSDTEELLRDAQGALLLAHEDGERWHLVDDSRRGFHTLVDEQRLRTALEDDEFVMHYQPIVSLQTRRIVGVEALLRWLEPGATRVGYLQPRDFLPLLERTGLSVQVGERTMRQACEQVVRWQELAPQDPPLLLCCNIGPRQLASANIGESILDTARGAGLDPSQLCVDLTESALRLNRVVAWRALRDLKEAGALLGLGDFGVGESGILWLRELPIDIVRIDRYYADGIRSGLQGGLGLDHADATIVRHVAALARDLGVIPIGEGIESEAEADAFTELGVELGQGYHFGRPEPANAITAMLAPDTAGGAWDASQILRGGGRR